MIRALLRAEEPEPARAPEPPARAVEAPPPPAPESPRVEPKPAPPPGATRESKSVAAIPATFLDPSALTEKPRPLREPRLDLLTPILARAGLVHLVLYINEHGVVEDVQIDSATLPPAAVERAAAIFAAVPFSPGRIEGTAVRTRVRITVGAEERGKED